MSIAFRVSSLGVSVAILLLWARTAELGVLNVFAGAAVATIAYGAMWSWAFENQPFEWPKTTDRVAVVMPAVFLAVLLLSWVLGIGKA